MLATSQGVALPNPAFSLLIKSVQQTPLVPKTPSEHMGTPAPSTQLADTDHHVDVVV